MAKIAITGMTASQRSHKLNQRSLCFAGALSDAITLTRPDTYVDWMAPSVAITESDISKYDTVIVGVSPLTSLSSNYAYPALATISAAKNVGNLALFVDSPDPEKIRYSLSAVAKDGGALWKHLYSARPGYQGAMSDTAVKRSIEHAVEYLASDVDAAVLYPSLPFFSNDEQVASAVGVSKNNVVGLNFDLMYLQPKTHASAVNAFEERRWLVDGHSTSWFKKLQKSLQLPWTQLRTRRTETDDQVLDRIRSSISVILSPQHNGECWWSHRYAQTLSTLTPIASEWRSTSRLAPAWSTLAVSIESMDMSTRMTLAVEQLESYRSALSSVEDQTHTLLQRIGILDGHTV